MRHLRVGARQPRQQLVDARLVHDQAARGRAALAGRADGAEHDRRHDEIEVGVVVDDDRVVAAALEQRLAEAGAHRARRPRGRPRTSR